MCSRNPEYIRRDLLLLTATEAFLNSTFARPAYFYCRVELESLTPFLTAISISGDGTGNFTVTDREEATATNAVTNTYTLCNCKRRRDGACWLLCLRSGLGDDAGRPRIHENTEKVVAATGSSADRGGAGMGGRSPRAAVAAGGCCDRLAMGRWRCNR